MLQTQHGWRARKEFLECSAIQARRAVYRGSQSLTLPRLQTFGPRPLARWQSVVHWKRVVLPLPSFAALRRTVGGTPCTSGDPLVYPFAGFVKLNGHHSGMRHSGPQRREPVRCPSKTSRVRAEIAILFAEDEAFKLVLTSCVPHDEFGRQPIANVCCDVNEFARFWARNTKNRPIICVDSALRKEFDDLVDFWWSLGELPPVSG